MGPKPALTTHLRTNIYELRWFRPVAATPDKPRLTSAIAALCSMIEIALLVGGIVLCFR